MGHPIITQTKRYIVRNECKVETQTVTKYMPMTSCEKVPYQLCAPVNCGFKEVRRRGKDAHLNLRSLGFVSSS